MGEPDPALRASADPERVVHQQARLRQVNQAIMRGRDREDDQHLIGFVCECGRAGCARIIELTPADYEAVRVHPGRYAVADGHQVAGLQRLVAVRSTYAVVELISPV